MKLTHYFLVVVAFCALSIAHADDYDDDDDDGDVTTTKTGFVDVAMSKDLLKTKKRKLSKTITSAGTENPTASDEHDFNSDNVNIKEPATTTNGSLTVGDFISDDNGISFTVNVGISRKLATSYKPKGGVIETATTTITNNYEVYAKLPVFKLTVTAVITIIIEVATEDGSKTTTNTYTLIPKITFTLERLEATFTYYSTTKLFGYTPFYINQSDETKKKKIY